MKILFLLSVALSFNFVFTRYTPDWVSLDARPLPNWYDDSKLGIFIHWGSFSVPGFGSPDFDAAFFWYCWNNNSAPCVEFMSNNYKPRFTYPEFASLFTAEFYDPKEWAEIFAASGAKYIVLTSKHHEGFTLWPSKVSWNWNAMDIGPKRDLLGDLADAIRSNTDLHFGVYHSMFEWFHPLYLMDKNNSFKTQYFVDTKTMPELYELVNNYEPEVIWSDGDWEAPDTYWKATEFLAWLYNESPVKDKVVVNDRWGKDIPCHHGGYFTCTDKYNPKTLQKHKWENAMTLDKSSWGYRRNAKLSDFLTMEELVTTLAETVSCGGNLLLNVGPTSDGRIIPIFEERLRGLGSWLKINGESIYGSKPWILQNDTITPGVWYTSKGKTVYAIVLQWPKFDVLTLSNTLPITTTSTITMLGYPNPLSFRKTSSGVVITFPALTPDAEVSKWAWVLKFTELR